jgi:hypothetical protein
MGLVTKPRTLDTWEPTNASLWDRVQRLAQGELKELKTGDSVYHAPRNGAGFKEWPSPRATGWCIRIYNLAGGRWRAKGETKEANLTDNMERRVASRHATKLAKMLGDDLRKKMAGYREGPNRDWDSCAGCSNWVATAPTNGARRNGRCLKHAFAAISLGYCPAHQEM